MYPRALEELSELKEEEVPTLPVPYMEEELAFLNSFNKHFCSKFLKDKEVQSQKKPEEIMKISSGKFSDDLQTGLNVKPLTFERLLGVNGTTFDIIGTFWILVKCEIDYLKVFNVVYVKHNVPFKNLVGNAVDFSYNYGRRIERWKYVKANSIEAFEKINFFPEDFTKEAFGDDYYKVLTNLFNNRNENFNYVIVTNDEKEVRVNKEVIVIESDYFFKIIKFGGKETRKEGFLIIDSFCEDELMMFIGFIYTRKVVFGNGIELKKLFNLLCKLESYEDRSMKRVLVEKILEISIGFSTKELFFSNFIRDFGYYFHKDYVGLKKETKFYFIEEWVEKISDIKLNIKGLLKAIENSFFGKRLQEESDIALEIIENQKNKPSEENITLNNMETLLEGFDFENIMQGIINESVKRKRGDGKDEMESEEERERKIRKKNEPKKMFI